MEGEFYVMGPKYLQKEIVLGRQLAEIALCLQKSQAVLEDGQRQARTDGCTSNHEPKMTIASRIMDSLTKIDMEKKIHMEKQEAQAHNKSHKKRIPKDTCRMLEPDKGTVRLK